MSRRGRDAVGLGRSARLAACAALLAAGCGRAAPLAYRPVPVPIGHDAEDVLDLAVVDVEGDGQPELVAARADGLHLLRRRDGSWQDETPGSGLDRVAAVDALVADGRDLLVSRDGVARRLRATDVGTWVEAPDDEPSPPAPGPGEDEALRLDVDLDGDGALDRARIEGSVVRVLLRDVAGTLTDVTLAVASDALPLRGSGRRILAADLDADGDVDLVAVGGRVLVLLSNGGRRAPDVKA